MIKATRPFAFVLLACTVATAHAQIGALPLLDSLPAAGECHGLTVNDELQRQGVVRLVRFTSRSPTRSIFVAVNARGQPQTLTALTTRTLTGGKNEGEKVFAFFAESGRVASGDRSYTTLVTLANSPKDLHGGLLAADTTRVERLATTVLSRCGG
jgi:hypothetical protein